MVHSNVTHENDVCTLSDITPPEEYSQLALPLEYGAPITDLPKSTHKAGHRFSIPPLKLKTLGQVGLLLLALGMAIAWTRQQRVFATPSATAVVNQVNTLKVEAIELEPSDSFTITRQYTGQVAALRTSDLGFEQGGTLVWVGVDRGDRITKGTPLARLDTRNLEAQRSQLEAQRDQAMAVLAELQRGPRQEDIDAASATVRDLENQLELERIRQSRREYVVEEGAIAREELDIVALSADALAERLASAQSQLQELLNGTRPEQVAAQEAVVQQLAAQITNIDVTIDKSTIVAPFDGLIGERQQDEGTVVGASQPVVRLVEAAQPEVEIGVPSN
ncbi:MAG: HlyD family secretion protein, partial [Leptolyngbyaceae cyanobacterium]